MHDVLLELSPTFSTLSVSPIVVAWSIVVIEHRHVTQPHSLRRAASQRNLDRCHWRQPRLTEGGE
jgi:hypothetical protein